MTDKRWSRRWLVVSAILALMVGAMFWAVRNAGRWLVVDDKLQKAQVIVVLSGITPYRAIEAAQIYQQGWAQQVWLFKDDPRGADTAFADLGIHQIPEQEYDQAVLERLGVPKSAIRIMDVPTTNTASEFELLREELRRENADKVILVTSPLHTRRAQAIWRVIVGEHPQAIVRYDTSEPSDPAHWWRATSDTQDVLHEFLGLINARLGFVIKPAKP